MIKQLSATSFVSVVLFTAINYTHSKFLTSYLIGANFGWPFVFFTSDPEKEIMAGKSFSLINLSIDFFICLIIGFLLVQILSVRKRRKNNLAKNFL
jgi:general stress protein CsbA